MMDKNNIYNIVVNNKRLVRFYIKDKSHLEETLCRLVTSYNTYYKKDIQRKEVSIVSDILYDRMQEQLSRYHTKQQEWCTKKDDDVVRKIIMYYAIYK